MEKVSETVNETVVEAFPKKEEAESLADEKGYFFEEELTYTKLGQTVKLCSGVYDATTKTFETEYETKAIVQSETPDAYTQGWQRLLLFPLS